MDYRPYPVLVVDDEVENLDAFTLNFGRKFTLKTARSGEEALALARAENIAVAIADQRMPGMLGTDFLKLLRKERPDAVRMILTGYTDLESVMAAINDGQINRYITKPWDARDLESLVRNAIDHYKRGLERKHRLKELSAYNRILQLIAGGKALSRVVKEVLQVTALEFGYVRTFLLLGDPAAGALRGQAVILLPDKKPFIQKISALAKGSESPLHQIVGAVNGFSAEKFVFSATTGDGDTPIEFACGPFYAAPLVVDGRPVGLLAADRGGPAGPVRTDRDDARFIATLANQIAVATGGHVTAEGLARKKGSGAPEETSGPSQDPAKTRRVKVSRKFDLKAHPILIVDDDSASLETFRINFGGTFTVLTARSAREGLEVLKARPVGVIVTDQRMPARPEEAAEATSAYAGMSGIDFLAEARDNNPDCVRMVLTGYGDIEEIIGAVNRGLVYRYITKPWDPNELGAALRNAVEFYHEVVESRRLLREAEVVNRLMTVVAGETDPQRVADAALRIAVNDLGYDRAYLFDYDEPTNQLVRGRVAVREGENAPAVERIRIPVIPGGGLLGGVILSGKPDRSSEGPHSPGGVEVAVSSRKATLAVPVGGENPLGVLAVEMATSNSRDFTGSDELTVMTLAEVLTVTIRQAGRLAELKALQNRTKREAG